MDVTFDLHMCTVTYVSTHTLKKNQSKIRENWKNRRKRQKKNGKPFEIQGAEGASMMQ